MLALGHVAPIDSRRGRASEVGDKYSSVESQVPFGMKPESGKLMSSVVGYCYLGLSDRLYHSGHSGRVLLLLFDYHLPPLSLKSRRNNSVSATQSPNGVPERWEERAEVSESLYTF